MTASPARCKPAWCVALSRLIALLCALVFFSTAAYAGLSALRFKQVRLAENDEVSVLALAQDAQGFIWIATNGSGIVRYDGYQTVLYAHDPLKPNSLPDNTVFAVFRDAGGRIWVGTRSGLARFNPDTNDFTRFAPATGPKNHLIVRSIISDNKDGMWLATWGGVQHFHTATGKFTLYQHQPGVADSLTANDTNSLVLDDKGGLWVATWPAGLDYLAPGASGFKHYRIDSAEHPDPKLNNVRALHFDDEKTLWIGTEAGGLTWNTGQDWRERKKLDGPAVRYVFFYADRDNTLWAGTLSKGLLRWSKGQRTPTVYEHRTDDPHSVSPSNMRAMLHDQTGLLWVGTLTGGIRVVNLNSSGFARLLVHHPAGKNENPNNFLTNIAAERNGRIWLAGNSGLSLYDPRSDTIIKSFYADPSRPNALNSSIVYSMYQAHDGTLWVGTAAGLHRIDPIDDKVSVVHFGEAANDFINTVVPGRDHTLWLGTGNSVIRYNTATGTHRTFVHDPADPNSRSVKSACCILEDRSGRVWIGSDLHGGGLDLLDRATGKIRQFRHQPGDASTLGNDFVTGLHEDARGRIWVSTANGLYELLTTTDGKVSFRIHPLADGSGSVKINGVQSDRTGHLWISTAASLLRLAPESGTVTRFGASDGLIDSYWRASPMMDDSGSLYFPGARGMSVVFPSMVSRKTPAPEVRITDIKVFNRSLTERVHASETRLTGAVTAPRALTLAPSESVFSIEFASLDYTEPLRNRYAYRLKGFNKNWTETDATRRSATYTNLDPGHYVFEVRTANDLGIWSTKTLSLPITVLPPYWKTWWFRTLAITMTLALLLTAFWLRIRNLTRHKIELQALVAERTRELEETNRTLAVLSTTDGLTGITNRRAFDTGIANEWTRAKRAGDWIAAVMIDIDHFKRYNDHYGHQAGDECLRKVASVIADQARAGIDIAARYGGEEFVLVAPRTGDAQVLALASRLCLAVAELRMPHALSSFEIVTISVGVAAMQAEESKTPAMLIAEADRALYRAKESGRNRACQNADGTVVATG